MIVFLLHDFQANCSFEMLGADGICSGGSSLEEPRVGNTAANIDISHHKLTSMRFVFEILAHKTMLV